MLLSVFFLLQDSACATLARWAESSETDSLNDIKNSRVGLLEVRRKKLLGSSQYTMPVMGQLEFYRPAAGHLGPVKLLLVE